MDELGKFNETSLSGKEDFYSHLNMFKVLHYYQPMYLRTLEICALKDMNFMLQNFFQHLDQHDKQL